MLKRAFTLAEVLITLGIIGVVAAITMPTLIQNYQKHVWYNQFLRAASTIENAVNRYFFEMCGEANGSCLDYENYDNLELAEFILNFSKYLNVLETNNHKNLKNYKPCTLNKEHCEDIDEVVEASCFVITTDGILIFFNTNYDGAFYLVDTNGPNKGPNIQGRDVFNFGIKNNNLQWAGTEKYLDNQDDCNLSGSGYFCAGRLLKERKMNY